MTQALINQTSNGLGYLLLQIINAPITPGTHAQRVRRNTINIEPHPLSITASGGKITQRITRQMDIFYKLMNGFQ
jgi:hypothetical protein